MRPTGSRSFSAKGKNSVCTATTLLPAWTLAIPTNYRTRRRTRMHYSVILCALRFFLLLILAIHFPPSAARGLSFGRRSCRARLQLSTREPSSVWAVSRTHTSGRSGHNARFCAVHPPPCRPSLVARDPARAFGGSRGPKLARRLSSLRRLRFRRGEAYCG